jgi:hypothetical protein
LGEIGVEEVLGIQSQDKLAILDWVRICVKGLDVEGGDRNI